MPKPIALVSARAARELDEDLPPLRAALEQAGIASEVVDWDDAAVDWRRFSLALLRSTWDYTQRLPEFLAWLTRVAPLTRLHNPLDLVRWNVDKHYLAHLQRSGVAVVPSRFIEPGTPAAQGVDEFLREQSARELVVKPAVGAGSRDAQRHGREDRAAIIAHVERLIGAGRSALLQPYLERVDAAGETALMHFDGVFSHAIRKGPLLARGAEPTRALFATEHITPRTPGDDELALAARAIAALPVARPLYARVDLLRQADGTPCVLELELAEPSLFFAHAADSAARFAQAIGRRVAESEGVNRPG